MRNKTSISVLLASTCLTAVAGFVALTGCSSSDGGGAPATQSQSSQSTQPPTPPPVVIPHYAYVASQTDNKVYAYKVDTSTGALTANGDVDVSPAVSPIQTAFDPFYRFAYVANSGSHNVSVYTLDTATGALTQVGTPVPTALNPISVAADPSGRFVYVANQSSANVSAFSLDASTGSLTPIAAPVPAGSEPFSVAVHPSGQFLYVSSGHPTGLTNDVHAFSINQTTGELTAVGPPVPAPAIPVHLTVHPTGRFLYVASGISSSVTAFSIDSTNGALTLVNTLPTGGSASRAVAVERTGRFAYVVSVGSNDVSIFNIDATTGALAAALPPVVSPFHLPGTDARFLAVDPSGGFLYVTYFTSPFVSELSIDGTTGALAHLGTVPTGAGSVGITVIGTP